MTFSSSLQRQTIIMIMMVMILKVIPLMVMIVVAKRVVTTAVLYVTGTIVEYRRALLKHDPIIVD